MRPKFDRLVVAVPGDVVERGYDRQGDLLVG